MTIEERRTRDRAARRRLIVTTARKVAEAEGWDAVTTRRLSTEIEYSQPVLYKHFSGMDAIAEAVAIDGFAELADALWKARTGAERPEYALRRIAHAYLDFARDNPAPYDAMFTRATTLHFAADDTPAALSAAFGELRAAVAATGSHADVDTVTEVVWAALHGLATLSRSGRLRPAEEFERIELLASQFGGRSAT
ncbi:TetR/AcrR family transcriptional regulator [Mycobacterium sp.]|uniref:TetR/AcrR family transcriptional regulator n=1 Tax=Mycobacterium sp. TaxID=1785 RepID=UPI002CB51929|nr:TetR/AcrR family transcriptional regulator [Mycobacterium sp.]HME50541.1 TetR/AcrR family transcriptional regulator [Mycobacterium sp.]